MKEKWGGQEITIYICKSTSRLKSRLERLFRSQVTMTKLNVRKCIKLYLWFVKQQQQQSLNTIYFQNKTDTEPVGWVSWVY